MIEQYMRKYAWARKDAKPLYLLVTQDKYRLPLAVADTMGELAKIAGVNESTICKCINNGYKNSRYERVYVNMEEDE